LLNKILGKLSVPAFSQKWLEVARSLRAVFDNMNALIYLRVSTDKQAEKGLSIPAQKEQCFEYAKKLNYGRYPKN